MAHALIVVAAGAPGSFARRVQEEPEIAVGLLRAARLALLILDRDGVRPLIGEAFTQTEREIIERAVGLARAGEITPPGTTPG